MYDFSFDADLCKAHVGDDGKLYLEGVASTTDVDAQQERMSLTALNDMEKCVPLPLTDSHKAELENEIGTVTEARHQDGKLFIKCELDADDPKAITLHKKLQKGAKAGFSVGGKVTAYTPGVEKTEKRIITGVTLDHIMLTKRPANANTFAMAFAKALSEIDADASKTDSTPENHMDTQEQETIEKAGAKFSSDTVNSLKAIHAAAGDPGAVKSAIRSLLGDQANDVLGAQDDSDPIGIVKTDEPQKEQSPALTDEQLALIKSEIVSQVRQELAKSSPELKSNTNTAPAETDLTKMSASELRGMFAKAVNI